MNMILIPDDPTTMRRMPARSEAENRLASLCSGQRSLAYFLLST